MRKLLIKVKKTWKEQIEKLKPKEKNKKSDYYQTK